MGDKIDSTFVQVLELLFIASYQGKSEKLPTIRAAIKRMDILKFFLRVAWELNALDNRKYAVLAEKCDDLGRMLGGWKKGLESKTPA